MSDNTARDDGGPAFPVQDASTWQGHGMSLRDYFAAKAMQAVLAGPDAEGWFVMNAESANVDAKYCYFVADRMLNARAAK